MEAFATCRLTIGMNSRKDVATVDAKPIRSVEVWLQPDNSQQTFGLGVLKLSPEFYETVAQRAVPLDYRALSALTHFALELDIYTWPAHRLCRIKQVVPLQVLGVWLCVRSPIKQSRTFPCV